MKKLLVPLLVVILSFAASDLSAQQKITKTDYRESSARNLEPEPLMMLTPLVADISVTPNKIVHVEKDAFKEFTMTPELVRMIPNFKKIALSRAARAHDADILVGTTVDVTTNSEGFIEITVTGYPGKYSSFRNIKPEDIELIRVAREVEHNENHEIIEKPEAQKFEIIDIK